MAFRKADSARASYAEIRHVLEQVVERHGWDPLLEARPAARSARATGTTSTRLHACVRKC